ncbi:IclR family transcriptional regulator [Nocardia pseudobrasiliensis]|uniref:IclR family transcriptional regulator n=1 Tax=Nocardia pseudobrasiliensis TaxID=45979 RepID=A0A370HPH7_9NOCA|nr:IclR family transcriptional regulator [Nocardia pseudobrasiliensis]RDI60357.1 IclR family transcriptional regulator [Nocardia pseudobrasiliensis]
MARSSSGESVLSRAVRIFEAFDADTPAVSVSELARRTGIPLATTSRLVTELVGYGWLRRDGSGRVRIGMRVWELVSRASPTLGLREAAMPFMQDLHAVVGNHVQLGVRQGHEVLYIERLSAPGAVRNLSRLAGRLPLHASSAGVVLLADSPANLQESVLAGPLPAFTPNTVTEPKALRALLDAVRRAEFVCLVGHIDKTTTSIAAPVRGAGGHTVAALALIVPNGGAARTYIPAVQATAHGISRALGAPVTPG